jgi:Putative addiction module component
MSSNAHSVLRDALALPEEERARVAEELFASLAGPDLDASPELAAQWTRDVERRIERVASGESVGIDVDTARSRVDAALADG